MESHQNCSAASEVLAFLNSIEGAGYGGMASFEIARQHVKEMVMNGDAQCAGMPLLPCPFCGKPTEYVCESDHHGDYFRLGCTDEDCPAHWTYYTEPQENAEECIRRWNTRALPQSSAETEDDK